MVAGNTRHRAPSKVVLLKINLSGGLGFVLFFILLLKVRGEVRAETSEAKAKEFPLGIAKWVTTLVKRQNPY